MILLHLLPFPRELNSENCVDVGEKGNACVFSCSVVSDSLKPRGLCSLPGSSVCGISQARILQWLAISSSRGSSRSRDQTCLLRLLHWQANSLPLSHLGSPEKGNDKYLIYSETAKGGRNGKGEEKKEGRKMAVALISETCRV